MKTQIKYGGLLIALVLLAIAIVALTVDKKVEDPELVQCQTLLNEAIDIAYQSQDQTRECLDLVHYYERECSAEETNVS